MKRASFVGCLIVVVLGLVGGLYYLSTQIPDVAQQMPPNASPIVVTLTTPLNDAAIPLNDAVTIGVDAIGAQPIVAVELWIDGTRTFTRKAEVGQKQFAAAWSWTAPSEGTHTLIARAMDVQQHEGQSNVVRVVASKEANPTTQIAYKTQSGDTVPVIAQKFKVPPQQVIDANPQLSPSAPIPPGQDVSVPVPVSGESGPGAENSTPDLSPSDPLPPPTDSGQSTPPGPPDKNILWFKGLGNLFNKSEPPAKPNLMAVLDGCNVKLTIADHALNEDGFYIYRLGKKPSPKPVATLGANSGITPFIYTDANLTADEYTYYVVAFNTGGNALSNLAQVEVLGTKCNKPNDVLEIQNPILQLVQPLDKVYCYLKIGSADWQRIPHAPNTFLSPSKQGTFDVNAYLKGLPITTAQSQLTLELDCWGWKGTDLVYLGNAKQTVGSGSVNLKTDQYKFTALIPKPDFPVGVIGITPFPENMLKGGNPSIPVPVSLANTNNPKVCTSHMPGVLAILGGEFACQQAIGAGNYGVLVWEWPGCWPGAADCIPAIDGYRLYRENFPAPTFLKEAQGQDLKTAMFPLPAPMWPPGPNDSVLAKIKYDILSKNCYFVRAFKEGAGESGDSNHVCLPFDSGLPDAKTIKIPAGNWLTRYVYEEECNAIQGLSDQHGLASSAGPQEIQVGYYYTTDGCNFAWVARGAVWFDTSVIPAQAWVVKSNLQYTLGKTDYNGNIATNEYRNCANRLMVGTQQWMGVNFGDKKYWIPGDSFADLSTYLVNPNLAIDVTGAVKEWVQGTHPNDGFVFRQSEEGMHTSWDSVCTSIYKDFSLEVTYYP